MTKSKKIEWAIAVVYVLGLAWTELSPNIDARSPLFPNLDKFLHFSCYALPAILFCDLLGPVASFLFLVAYGIGLEFGQKWGGVRIFEYADIAANTAGVCFGILIWKIYLYRWLDRFHQRWN